MFAPVWNVLVFLVSYKFCYGLFHCLEPKPASKMRSELKFTDRLKSMLGARLTTVP